MWLHVPEIGFEKLATMLFARPPTIPLHQCISSPCIVCSTPLSPPHQCSFTNALALTGEGANGLVKGDGGVEQNNALVRRGMSIHRKLILTYSIQQEGEVGEPLSSVPACMGTSQHFSKLTRAKPSCSLS